MKLNIGENIGSYKIIDYIGSGSMAKVYKAEHNQLSRPAAIKILHERYEEDQDFNFRFMEEGKSLASLRHANIVQIYDLDTHDEVPYLVMEFIEGETLKVLIQTHNANETRLPLKYAIKIIYSLSLGLLDAHEKGIIHRDVKPSNVIIEDSGRIVLTDFGLAKLASSAGDTKTGEIIGTPAYMAPEAIVGEKSSARSDIYSLGIIFYEMLAGKLPYESENPITVAMKHINNPIPSVREIVPEIPNSIDKIIKRALIKNPNQRYGEIGEFLLDLSDVRLETNTVALSESKANKWSITSSLPGKVFEGKRMKGNRFVCLHIMETGQLISLALEKNYSMGRKHSSSHTDVDIDLTPFEAFKWGISRYHAKLFVSDDRVSLTDKGSSNGSYVNGIKIDSDIQHNLVHGDLIQLGKLKFQVLVYT